MTAQELIRTEGSVFVQIAPPQTPDQTTTARRTYQEWTDVAGQIASEVPTPAAAAAAAAKTITQPVSDNPVGEKLNALLAEVDNLLDPPARVNTQPIRNSCYHYENPIKPKIDYDAPLRAWWDRVMQKRSDEHMAYLKNRKAVA